MKLETMNQLFVAELQDLYSVETQIIKALPKMIEKTKNPQLRTAFQTHLQQTQQQLERLNRIFDQVPDVDRDDETCEGMKGILEEGEDIIKNAKDDDVRDAGMIAAAQKVEHYEIASYGTARTYAQLLGRRDWAQLLEQTLQEEKDTDHKLNQLAEHVNVEARAA